MKFNLILLLLCFSAILLHKNAFLLNRSPHTLNPFISSNQPSFSSKLIPNGNPSLMFNMTTKPISNSNLISTTSQNPKQQNQNFYKSQISSASKSQTTVNQTQNTINSTSKETLTLTLPNNLKVLIIKDSTLKFNGIALTVSVGSSYEPANIPGLAHLLEHMLFMKSNKYPKEGYFKHHLGLYNGKSNAMTSDISTTYYFMIKDQQFQHFSKISSIFSRFFIDPILESENIKREIQAVHNEYENDLVSNGWRFQELLRNLANNNSVFRHFSIGNKLKLDTDKHNIHEEILKFHKDYYSSHKMHLIIYGNHPINELKQLSNYFNEIPYNHQWDYPKHLYFLRNNNNKTPIKEMAFPKKYKGKFVFYNPLGNLNSLAIVFPLENEFSIRKNDVKPLEFFIKLLSYKGKGGFYAELIEKKLITGFSIGLLERFINLNMLIMKFDLESSATKQIKIDILEIYFAYMRNLKENAINLNFYKEISYRRFLEMRYRKRMEFKDEILDYLKVFKDFNNYDEDIQNQYDNFERYDQASLNQYDDLLSNPRNSLIIFTEDSEKIRKFKGGKAKILKIPRFSGKNSLYFTSENFRNSYINNEKNINFDINDALFQQEDLIDNDFHYEKTKGFDISSNFRQRNPVNLTNNLIFFDATMKFLFKSEEIPISYLKIFTNNSKIIIKSPNLLNKNKYYPERFGLVSNCPFQRSEYQELFADDINYNNDYHIEYDTKESFDRYFWKNNENFNIFQEDFNANKIKIYNKTCYLNEKIEDFTQNQFKEPLFNNSNLKVFYKTDKSLDIPKISAILEIQIRSKKLKNIKDDVFLLVFLKLFEEKYSQILFEIREIWGSVTFEVKNSNIRIKFFGFSDKFDKVIEKVLNLIKKASFSLKDFLKIKRFFFEILKLKEKQAKRFVLLQYVMKLLHYNALLDSELFNHLKMMKFNDLKSFINRLKNNIKTKVLVVGNVYEEEVYSLSETISKIFPFKPKHKKITNNIVKSNEKSKKPIKKFAKNFENLKYSEVSENAEDNNSYILNIYFKENYSKRDIIKMKMIYKIFSSKAFNYLRTIKQLGYIVASQIVKNKNFSGISVIIQSSTHSPDDMDQEVENFLLNLKDFIQDKSNSEILSKNFKKSNVNHELINALKSSDLEEKTMKLWRIIAKHKKKSIIKKHIKDIKYEEMIDFYNDLFFQARHKVGLQIISQNHKTFQKTVFLRKEQDFSYSNISEIISFFRKT